jgi:hypothetical protein
MSDRLNWRPKDWDNEVLRLETKVEETAKLGIELGKELAQANLELERWRHGKQIESDYICENALELDKMRGAYKQAQDREGERLGALDDVKLLKRKLAETEKAGEDIRQKNGELVDENKRMKARLAECHEVMNQRAASVNDLEENKRMKARLQIDPGGSDKIDELEEAMAQLRTLVKSEQEVIKLYHGTFYTIGMVFKLNLPYLNNNDFTRGLFESELGAICSEVLNLYNRKVAMDNSLLGKKEEVQTHLGDRATDETLLRVGLKRVSKDDLKGIDKVTISADGLDWEGLSHKYYELLSLARKFNMAIVVLP